MIPPPPPLPSSSSPATMEQNSPNQPPVRTTALIIVMNVVNTVTQIVLGAVAFSAFFFANIFTGPTALSQHIFLCVFGYVILMTQAILTLSPYCGWANSLKYPNKKLVHWMMQVIGSVLVITGSIIRISSTLDSMQTAHGIFGILALILTVMSLIGGAANLAFPKQLSTVIFRTAHILVGVLTISVAYVSLCFGFDGMYRGVMGDLNADISISLTILALVGVLSGTCMNLAKRFLSR